MVVPRMRRHNFYECLKCKYGARGYCGSHGDNGCKNCDMKQKYGKCNCFEDIPIGEVDCPYFVAKEDNI